MGAYAASLLTAGIFVTDPALGYPVGAPIVHTTHGLIHGLAGLAAFTFLTAASFVMAWRFWSDRASRPLAVYSLLTGLLIIASFVATNVFSVMDAQGSLQNAPTGFVQRIAIVCGWTWIALVAWRLIRKDDAKDHLRGGRRAPFRNLA